MGSTVLPSINCAPQDTEAVAAGLRQAAAAGAEMVHFDVADGAFTFHKTWDEPEQLAGMVPKPAFEVHLMVAEPLAAVQRWLAAGARRVIVHMETISPRAFAPLAAAIRAAGAEPVLGMNPETPADNVLAYAHATSSFLVLSVHPGMSGQKFLPRALETVAFLRRTVPNAKIEIDGAMNPETARAAIAAGADSLVSGSYLFESADPAAAYKELSAL